MNMIQTIFKRMFIFVQLILIAFVLGSTIIAAPGNVDPTFNINAERFSTVSVDAIALQPDGKILVSGNFTSANGLPINSIARFNPDGSLDTSFIVGNIAVQNTSSVGPVNEIAVQPDGKILIGGTFISVGGVSRVNIARLNADGSLDSSFVVASSSTGFINGRINKIAFQSDEKILVGGAFSISVTVQGAAVTRSNLVRFNSDGSFDSSFGLILPGSVADIAIQPDGKILVGGVFGFVARINPDGSLDQSFANLNVPNSITGLALQPDGKIVVVGSFSSYGGFSQGRITRLNSDGTLDTTFNVNQTGANSNIYDVELTPDGKIFIVGEFSTYNNVVQRNISRLNSDGSLDTSFTNSLPNFAPREVIVQTDGKIIVARSGSSFLQPGLIFRLNTDGSLDTNFAANVYLTTPAIVSEISVQPDGKTYIGGNFTFIGGVQRTFLARLNADGTVDPGFVPDLFIGTGVGSIYALAVQADGKVLVGGELGTNIQRLNTDGSKDTTFSPPRAVASIIYAIAIQSDGKILVPNISSDPSSSNSGIVRLNIDGSVDNSFNTNVSSIQEIILQPDGKIIIGGGFNTVNNVSRGKIARLNANGSLDTSFNPPFGANNLILTAALQPDGKIIAGGQFTAVNGVSRNYLARFNSDGSLDTSFVPNPNLQVHTIALQPDGKILVGGLFTTIDGVTRNRYARLNANGTVDLSFNSTVGANEVVLKIVLLPDDKILIGGSFTRVDNQPHIGLARLFNGTAAIRPLFDFDGDGKADLSVFRPSNGFWYELRSQNNSFYALQFGQSSDKLAPADYDGDGRADIAVFRENVPGAGDKAYFYITNSSDSAFRFAQFGTQGDLPMSGDWDGDGIADLAVYREAAAAGGQSFFFYRPSSQSGVDFRTIAWGTNGDKPVMGDFDGDGKLDAAVFRPSNGVWYILQSSNNQFIQQQFGLPTDILVPADYDGDGKTNIAVFRPSTGYWYTSTDASTGFGGVLFGTQGDVPVPADYDGDGKADIAVFRPSNGVWYLLRSQAGFTGVQFGAAEDRPIPNVYIR